MHILVMATNMLNVNGAPWQGSDRARYRHLLRFAIGIVLEELDSACIILIGFLLIEEAQLLLNRLNLVHIVRWLLKLETDLDKARLAKYFVVLSAAVLKVAVNAR